VVFCTIFVSCLSLHGIFLSFINLSPHPSSSTSKQPKLCLVEITKKMDVLEASCLIYVTNMRRKRRIVT
jgi:hypothetical protein